jgi:hypothetical protein
VKCHVANILSKMGVASRLQAVVEAHRRGLVANGDGEGLGQEEVLGSSDALGEAPMHGSRRFGSANQSRG